MTKPRFRLGDLVRHKASGERGVITGVGMRCTAHPPCHPSHFFGQADECEFEFDGTYDLSTTLANSSENVCEGVLERVYDSSHPDTRARE